MRIKRKNGLKIAAITIALLLCLALAVGITGAWYQAKRQATGTLSMDQGIIIDYKGFNGSETGATWERGTIFELFSTKAGEVQPGAHIKVNPASIKANEKSVNFYARVRLEYKFYNGEAEVTLEDPTVLIKTSNLFGSNWEFSSMAAPKDYYYYVENGTTTFKTMQAGADFVELIQSNAEFIIEGEGFKGSNDLEGGGFVVDETTSINKIVVNLVLETLQGDADPATEGWKFATPVRFAEATGKMETSVKKESTTENLNVSVAGATEVPINEVVFPYDTDTTLKFDSNNVEYVTLTYSNGESETFDAATYEVAENTFKLNAKSSKGTVTGYTVGLWNDSEYTGLTYSRSNTYDDGTGNSETCELADGYVAVSGYFGNSAIELVIPSDKVSVRERDFKTVLTFTDYNSFNDAYGQIAGSLQYPCTFKCEGFEKTFKDFNELNLWSESLQRNFILKSPLTITYKLLCESDSIFAKKYAVSEVGFGAFAMKQFTKLVLSDNITRIGYGSFIMCENLEEIKLSNSLTTIDNSAFFGCSKLTKIEIPSSVTQFGPDLFEECGITEVTINSSYVASLDSNGSDLFTNATKVYVKTGLTVGTYITNSFTKAEASDKVGYDMYTKKA